MGLWFDEVFEDRARFGLKVERTLFAGRSEYQHISVFETEQFGRALAIDGIFMTSEGDEHFYHEMLVHPAMTTAPRVRRVLVIGGGDGGTVREVLRHQGVEKVVMVEIDRKVVEVCKEHLGSIGTAWDDPRLDVRFDDAVKYVQQSDDEPFDVVLLDGTDPVGPGAGLFEQSFYEGCRRMMADDGVFALQSESPLLFPETFASIQRNLGKMFDHVRPCFGPVPIYASGVWSWTVASSGADPLEPKPERVEAVVGHTKYYNHGIHVGSFAVPNNLRKHLHKG